MNSFVSRGCCGPSVRSHAIEMRAQNELPHSIPLNDPVPRDNTAPAIRRRRSVGGRGGGGGSRPTAAFYARRIVLARKVRAESDLLEGEEQSAHTRVSLRLERALACCALLENIRAMYCRWFIGFGILNFHNAVTYIIVRKDVTLSMSRQLTMKS
ncbi:hypothetical protein EVAR_5670_1 [Eumeta japonica]|uniref:Uncharacterized protein n=1 Tax=Eumeta variegata TaxID=151549 RepID=A0A4C1TA53_EUMVA|nr:hypothetical protein EVAR_5670_1 [Eumeta japonica]